MTIGASRSMSAAISSISAKAISTAPNLGVMRAHGVRLGVFNA